MKISRFIIIASLACLIACTGEITTIFLSAKYYPGFDPLKRTMSSLGASNSSISNQISLWWIIMGLLLMFFAIGFKLAFKERGMPATVASWLIAIYGLGEGIGSAAFKVEKLSNSLTLSGIYHEVFSGIGVIAVLIFPAIMLKIISKLEMPFFYRISQFALILGTIFIILFLFRYIIKEASFPASYKGLWQRLYMLNTYIYLMSISIVMIIKNQNTASK